MYSLLLIGLLAVVQAQPPVWWTGGACGLSSYDDAGEACPIGQPCPAPRIVGGIAARPNEFPWQAAIRDANGFKCGGVVLNERWVVSAATCTNGMQPSELTIVLGAVNRTQTSVSYAAEAVFEHEMFDAANYANDISLIKTTANITMGSDVTPICAPDPAAAWDGYDCEVSGWGTLSSGGNPPEELYYTTVRTINNTACQAMFTGNDITDGMICAGDDANYDTRDTCKGDAGGPMGWKDDGGQYTLVGLTSWGISCAAGYPGVYTRVSLYTTWITEKMEKN